MQAPARALILAAILGSMLAAHAADISKPSDVGVAGPLECIIRAEPTCTLGEAPKVYVTLKNRSGREVLLASCLDQSDRKRRYPHCLFEIELPPDAQKIAMVITGAPQPLIEGSFVAVPKGGSFDPFANGFDGRPRIDGETHAKVQAFKPAVFNQPGVYKIRFVYSTNSAELKEWNPGPVRGKPPQANPKLEELVNRVLKTQVISNQISVEVLPAK